MSGRRVDAVLAEILDAIEGIQKYTDGISLEDFKQDWLIRLAVQRALEIISEASRHLPDALLSLAPDIPWKQIHGIGNVLRHEYHTIADDVIWSVIERHLKPLKAAVLKMLRSTHEERK
ncbi:hypothetical protein ASE36_17495 [Rhizobium sp. Root274]|uniref:HepT-like ribonuclease domain-containing protein n=1 Tax=unclassified Rhizobium TaxID=2613769 RepID=UPI000712CAC5|nr:MULTISPECIES: HepT-like ribonuclease domain-containing protein [unclassified Rhizobium]KQW27409.1 hypothetical protein ASC71_17525 [Rhizobium sp. Root1240]KRD27644.1 hypothetical protein ASE36_17495 [Rhizobium sp. Root274]